MSDTALLSAQKSIYRKLRGFANVCGQLGYDLEAKTIFLEPQDTLRLADELNLLSNSLLTGIALLRYEAKRVIDAKKGEAA
jgi:hypothetical protein